MAGIIEVHEDELALFQKGPTESGVQSKEWISHRPINQLTDGSAIEFSIPGTSTTYMDLKNSLLYIKLKIVKSDGSDITVDDEVALTNAPLHSIFSQIDLNVQQQPVNEVGNNYSYKAYIDTVLNEVDERKLSCQLFFVDSSGHLMDDPSTNGGNSGLYARASYTKGGKEADMIGSLALDLCQQDRFLLNGVPLNLKLWQSLDSFRLMSPHDEQKYKVVITDACLKIAVVKVNPSVLIAQSAVLKEHSALYPYTRSNIKTYAVPMGQYSFITDDLFQGAVPKKLIVGLVSSSAIHGNYAKNPYNFQNFDCNYAGFFVDGKSTPSHPLQPNVRGNHLLRHTNASTPTNVLGP